MPALKGLRQEDGKPQARLYFKGPDMVLSGGNQVKGTWEATDQPSPTEQRQTRASSQKLTFIS